MNRFFCCLLTMIFFLQTLSAQEIPSTDRFASSGMTLPYRDWYSFEKPEEDYTRQFLKSTIAPVALAGIGLLIQANEPFKHELQSHLDWNKGWAVNMYDDELRYLPTAVAATLPVFGVYSKHKALHLISLAAASYIFADFCVFRLKEATGVQRPNEKLQDLYNSFPSQHTSMAFVGATILHREYGHYSPWISVGGYAVAAWVGYSRIAQSYHWTADVLVGAAIGTLATNMVYWGYDGLSDWICKDNGQILSITPVFDGRNAFLSFNYQF